MTEAVILSPDTRRLAGNTVVGRTLERLAQVGIGRVFATSVPAGAHAELTPLPPADDAAAAIRSALASRVLAREPFLIVDGNVAWFDGPAPAIRRLLGAFAADGSDADALLLLVRATEIGPRLDRTGLALDPLGSVHRPPELAIAPFVAAGLRVAAPSYFDRAGSLDELREHAIDAGRLRGVVHDGIWFELATDEDLAEAEATLEDRLAGARP